MKIFCSMIILFLCGCASSQHAEKTADILAEVAENVALNSKILFMKYPEFEEVSNRAKGTSEKAAEHAEEKATPASVNIALGAAKNVLGPYGDLIMGGLSLVGLGGVGYVRQKKKKSLEELLADLVKEPDPEKCKLRLKGVTI